MMYLLPYDVGIRVVDVFDVGNYLGSSSANYGCTVVASFRIGKHLRYTSIYTALHVLVY